ncbi:TPA: hypothetical protein N0F65_008740, partial [Lagenidium giganteum]
RRDQAQPEGAADDEGAGRHGHAGHHQRTHPDRQAGSTSAHDASGGIDAAAGRPQRRATATTGWGRPRAMSSRAKAPMKKSAAKERGRARGEGAAAPPLQHRRSNGMLSVIELCNNDTEEEDGNRGDGEQDDADEDVDVEEDPADAVILKARRASTDNGSVGGGGGGSGGDAGAADDDDDAQSTSAPIEVDDEDESTGGEEEGWSDHNRWYCNICKVGGSCEVLGLGATAVGQDGGELLCCDRCPRAFHMSCLGMKECDIPESEWFCKACSYVLGECLDRRRTKKENKEKARLMREAAKLEREAKKQQVKQMQEDKRAKKSADAVEKKAKRVLEMQDRIVNKKKFKYKDKDEETLGKIAEDLGQTIRSAKEHLEKASMFNALIDFGGEYYRPVDCSFANIPLELTGRLLAVWDGIFSFRQILKLSPMSVDQFSAALARTSYSRLLSEVHMCLLELILEDREEEDYVSDDEGAMDETERYRYELQHAPMTVGAPTSNMLNSLSWPSVMYNLLMAIPRFMASASASLKAAVTALQEQDYPQLDVAHKLELLSFLVSRVYTTEKVRRMLNTHLDEVTSASKVYTRQVLQEKKIAMEEEKKMRDRQRAELNALLEKSKGAMKTWLKNDKKGGGTEDANMAEEDDGKSDAGGAGSAGSGEESDLEELVDNEEALTKQEEDLEALQESGALSRHEYLSRKKKLDNIREKVKKRAEERLRKQKAQEQIERKRTAAKKGIQEGLISRDAALLRVAIDKGKECNLPEKIIVSATHVLELLDAEAARDAEFDLRKRKYAKIVREKFVRSEPIGRDRNQHRYWILHGDPTRLYVEQPGPGKLKDYFDGDTRSESARATLPPATWRCYGSQVEVTALIDSLDDQIPREAQLRAALKDNFELITKDMPVSKPGLLISDLLNDDSNGSKKRPHPSSSSTEDVDIDSWHNELKTWRKTPHEKIDIQAFRTELLNVDSWLPQKLKPYGSTWSDRAANGRADWLKQVNAMETTADAIAPLLAFEREIMSLQVKSSSSQSQEPTDEGSVNGEESSAENAKMDNHKSDDEDEEDEEDETVADDGTILWPTRKCRERWVDGVKKARTLSTLAVALASFLQRLEIYGISEQANDDATSNARRAKTEKEKRSRKERAAKKRQKKEEAEEDQDPESMDEWEEDCYICTEGGELLCCDGCRRVFHYTCVGLRRIPRGKTFCHHCDSSVKPVFPANRLAKHAPKEQDAAASSDAVSVNTDDGATEQPAANTEDAPKGPDDQWDVDCGVCKLGGELLCCDGCPRAFHIACIGLDELPEGDWFCDDCELQTCGACKKNRIRLDSHVICGSEDGTKGCERVFHLKCAKLLAVPEDDWYCKRCRNSMQR